MPGRTVASGPPPPEKDEREKRPPQGPEPFLGPYVAPPVGGPSQWMDAAWDYLGGRPAKEPLGYDPVLDVSWHWPWLGPVGQGDPASDARPEPEVEKLDDRPSVTTHEEPRERKKEKRSMRKDGGRGGVLAPRKRRPRVGGPSGWERFWGELAAGNNPFTGLPWGIDPATGKPWKPPERVEDTEKQDERRVYAEAEPEGERSDEDMESPEREAREEAEGPAGPVMPAQQPARELDAALLLEIVRRVEAEGRALHDDDVIEVVRLLAPPGSYGEQLLSAAYVLSRARARFAVAYRKGVVDDGGGAMPFGMGRPWPRLADALAGMEVITPSALRALAERTLLAAGLMDPDERTREMMREKRLADRALRAVPRSDLAKGVLAVTGGFVDTVRAIPGVEGILDRVSTPESKAVTDAVIARSTEDLGAWGTGLRFGGQVLPYVAGGGAVQRGFGLVAKPGTATVLTGGTLGGLTTPGDAGDRLTGAGIGAGVGRAFHGAGRIVRRAGRTSDDPGLVHLTDDAGQAGILKEGLIRGRGGIFALPAKTVARSSAAGRRMRTGLPASRVKNAIPIPKAAGRHFRRPLAIGPYSLWKRAVGTRFAPAGELVIRSGPKRSVGTLLPSRSLLGPRVAMYGPDVAAYSAAALAATAAKRE